MQIKDLRENQVIEVNGEDLEVLCDVPAGVVLKLMKAILLFVEKWLIT